MSSAVRIATEEWRQWARSRLAVLSLIVFTVLLIFTTVLSALDAQEAHHQRLHQQEQAEETFLNQPDRHPHRMVHYGHYVFRTPPPLAMLTPAWTPSPENPYFWRGTARILQCLPMLVLQRAQVGSAR